MTLQPQQGTRGRAARLGLGIAPAQGEGQEQAGYQEQDGEQHVRAEQRGEEAWHGRES
jgi:hypothetical protein